MSLRLASVQEVGEFVGRAEEWLERTGGRWANAKACAKSAVAEFLANEQGATIYPSRATGGEAPVILEVENPEKKAIRDALRALGTDSIRVRRRREPFRLESLARMVERLEIRTGEAAEVADVLRELAEVLRETPPPAIVGYAPYLEDEEFDEKTDGILIDPDGRIDAFFSKEKAEEIAQAHGFPGRVLPLIAAEES